MIENCNFGNGSKYRLQTLRHHVRVKCGGCHRELEPETMGMPEYSWRLKSMLDFFWEIKITLLSVFLYK